MASTTKRRPLPALIGLVALLVLTAVVWLRVLHRSDAKPGSAGSTCTSSAPPVNGVLPNPAAVTVQVLNATTQSGIGARVRQRLVMDGFTSPNVATNDVKARTNTIKATAEIRFGPSGKSGATLLRFYFPGAVLVPTNRTNDLVVVALGNAFTRVATPEEVAAATKAAKVSVSASPPPASGSAAGSGSASGSASGSGSGSPAGPSGTPSSPSPSC